MKEITEKDIKRLLPEMKPNRHKGDGGTALMLVGTSGFAGAAALAAKGCYRSGCGIVKLIVNKDIYPIVSCLVPEAIFTVTEDKEDAFIRESEKADALLIGCGLGNNEATENAVMNVISRLCKPLILDADGLNVLSGNIEYIKRYKGQCIITPHPGEAARLLGTTVREIESDRQSAAKELSRKSGAVAVLKGHGTVIADGDDCYLLTLGNPGMAKGGSGDILAGIITAFSAEGLSALDAALLGTAVHSLAGDLAAKEFTERAMLPTDLIAKLPEVFKR